MSIIGSSIYNNAGTGIHNGAESSGSLTMVNSTVSNNETGIFNIGEITINNSTIANNSAGGLVQTIYDGETNASIKNTILAGNGSRDCTGTVISLGYNLIQNASECTVAATDNLIGVDPLLGPLRNNGRIAPTHILRRGSPAIDAGNPILPDADDTNKNVCESADQRGISRTQNGRCDIGAYEAFDGANDIYVPIAQ